MPLLLADRVPTALASLPVPSPLPCIRAEATLRAHGAMHGGAKGGHGSKQKALEEASRGKAWPAVTIDSCNALV